MSSRLKQIGTHIAPLSISHGPDHPPLLELTMSEHLRDNAARHGSSRAVVSHWQNETLTYAQLQERSDTLARGLAETGAGRGDRVAICAGNCFEYIVLFYAVAKLGAILVALNPSYTEQELQSALKVVGVKVLFISQSLAGRSFKTHTEKVRANLPLVQLVMLERATDVTANHALAYRTIEVRGHRSHFDLTKIPINPSDIVNIQFTSGTTGSPKASCLTHRNLLNNALFIGNQMALTRSDILCIPVPLFHCFGMVLGTLAALSASSCAVYPSETFDPRMSLQAVAEYKCTALHGVPTMFLRMLEILQKKKIDTSSLRTGIAAGTVVTAALMSRITTELKLPLLTITYGMTETSPASTMSSVLDPLDKRVETVGRVLPHTVVKIVDASGKIVPVGTPGQVLSAGYLLQKCYWNDVSSSNACLDIDKQGTAFMKTGDLGVMDSEGYLRISGRVKDLIIRGGENINPSEVENHLVSHADISDSSIVGIQDELYGEVVGVFIESRLGNLQPDLSAVQAHCQQKGLAHYKIPAHVFHMGTEGLPASFPKTMSGKIQKYLLRAMGEKVVAARRARLRG